MTGTTEKTCDPCDAGVCVVDVEPLIENAAVESNSICAAPPSTETITRYAHAPGAALQLRKIVLPVNCASNVVEPGACSSTMAVGQRWATEFKNMFEWPDDRVQYLTLVDGSGTLPRLRRDIWVARRSASWAQ